MDINDITIGQAKYISAIFSANENSVVKSGLNKMIGEKVIIRTYSAGVWFGTLTEKEGSEVIIADARRMWRWQAKESISLSGLAIHGLDQERSQIVQAVKSVWLEAIEMITCSEIAKESIEGAPNAEAK